MAKVVRVDTNYRTSTTRSGRLFGTGALRIQAVAFLIYRLGLLLIILDKVLFSPVASLCR